MTVVVLRPDEVIESYDSVTGGADAAAVLADNSDASYITWFLTVVRFPEPSLPAGAVLKSWSAEVRVASYTYGNGGNWSAEAFNNGESIASQAFDATWWGTSPGNIVVLGGSYSSQTNFDLGIYWALFSGNGGYTYAAYLNVTYVAIPVVNVTAPTGTVGTSRPTVTWENTLDSSGGAQTHTEIKVFTDAVYGVGGFDPDTSEPAYHSGPSASAATSHVVAESLTNDNYRAYVRTAQTVNGSQHWSDWDYAGFTVDVAPPGAPTVDVSPLPNIGEIRLELTHSGAVTTDSYEIQRSGDGGLTYELVRTLLGDGMVDADGSGDAIVYDREAPSGDLIYRARAYHDYGGGDVGVSGWTSSSLSWSSAEWILRHPIDPSLDITVEMASYFSESRENRVSVFQPLGRSDAVAVSDTAGPISGSIKIRCRDAVDRAALDALLAESVPVYLQGPIDEHDGDRWIAITSRGRERVADKSWVNETLETLSWTEVGAPSGNLIEWPDS